VLVQGLSDRLAALERPADVASTPIASAPQHSATPAADPDGERDLTVAAIAALEATTDARDAAAEQGDIPVGAVSPLLAAHVARYEQALARLPWGIVVADADDRIAIANPAAVGLLHVRQAPVGTAMVDAFPDADRMAYALHRARQRGPDTATPVVLQFESPGLQAELDPLWDPVAGYLGSVVLLRPRNPDAAGQVEALVPALADALRAPMTSILGYSELLSRMSGLSEDQVSRYLQRIDANLARMQTMLGNLLTVIEMGGDATADASEAVDVEATVRTAVDRARPQFGEKALDVNVAVDGPLPQASANPRDLTQILDNLLAHAALRSPQGGDVTVAAAVREDAGGQRAIVISVRDRGAQLVSGASGVVEIDEGQTRPVSLTIVRLLAERQGGRAWAESDSHGAQFHVRLPVPRAA
jgi:signal transduction histidine kinase